MPFDIKIENILPPTDVQDPDAVALVFLNSIGYMSRGYDPKTPVESVRSSVPFRLFMDCLMRRPVKDWRVEDLAQELGTSIPTVYRHLGKLQAYDIIDEEVGDEGKSVHLKHYALPGAWKVTEANVTASMENIKRSVETIQALSERTGSGKTEGQPADSHRTFCIRICGAPPEVDDGSNVDEHIKRFLHNIEYLTTREGTPSDEDKVAFRLFKECFIERPDKVWTIDELIVKLGTTKPTIYRYVNELDAMGLLDRVVVEETAPTKKGFRLRYGKLTRAWEFVEAYIKVAMDNYRATVEHLQRLVEARMVETGGKGRTKAIGEDEEVGRTTDASPEAAAGAEMVNKAKGKKNEKKGDSRAKAKVKAKRPAARPKK